MTSPEIQTVLEDIAAETRRLIARTRVRQLSLSNSLQDPGLDLDKIYRDLGHEAAENVIEQYASMRQERRRFYGFKPQLALLHLRLWAIFEGRKWLRRIRNH